MTTIRSTTWTATYTVHGQTCTEQAFGDDQAEIIASLVRFRGADADSVVLTDANTHTVAASWSTTSRNGRSHVMDAADPRADSRCDQCGSNLRGARSCNSCDTGF